MCVSCTVISCCSKYPHTTSAHIPRREEIRTRYTHTGACCICRPSSYQWHRAAIPLLARPLLYKSVAALVSQLGCRFSAEITSAYGTGPKRCSFPTNRRAVMSKPSKIANTVQTHTHTLSQQITCLPFARDFLFLLTFATV